MKGEGFVSSENERIMSVEGCTIEVFSSIEGHGKSPCFGRSFFSPAVDVDRLGSMFPLVNMGFLLE